MAEQFLGEIRRVAFNWAPDGWAFCDGSLLSIDGNEALFMLLGTTYGGNGVTNFGLPDLRGRIPLGASTGGRYPAGQPGGAAFVALTQNQMPAHTHAVAAATAAADRSSPTGAVWAAPRQAAYGSKVAGTMAADSLLPSGGGQPHENRPPYLTVSYIIATIGIFPAQA